MAVIQISKIQVRRGQTTVTGMPQLSGGEFGWSVDEQRLFIGNGSVYEGAPAIGNTELVTYNGLFDALQSTITINHTYKSTSTIVTGTGTNFPVVRNLSDKVDDIVSAYDFGLVSDGTTDNTQALQHAINQLYLINTLNYPVEFVIPAGTYVVSGPVYIPKNTKLVGAGKDATIIKTVSTSSNTIFHTVDMSGNVSPNMASSSSVPSNVSIKGLGFETVSTTTIDSILVLDCAVDTLIDDCKFINLTNLVPNQITPNGTIGISLIGQGAVTCDNVSIDNCDFTNLMYGIVSQYDMKNLYIKNNKFNSLSSSGIIFSYTGTPDQLTQGTGPVNVLIESNIFYKIAHNAIKVAPNYTGSSNNINSTNNYFKEVGNNFNGEVAQAYEVILFGTPGNISSHDTFDRTNYLIKNTIPTLTTSTMFQPVVTGGIVLQSDQVLTLPVNSNNPADNYYGQGPFNLLTVPFLTDNFIVGSSLQDIEVEYALVKPGFTKKGKLTILASNTTGTITESYTTNGILAYDSNGDGGLTFSLSINRLQNLIEVQYTNNQATDPGTIYYTYTVTQ